MIGQFGINKIGAVCTAAIIGFTAAVPAVAEDFSRDEIEQIVYEYLLEHPEVILEAVSVLEQRQAAEEAERQSQALASLSEDIFGGDSTMVAGNPDGDVTIVEFFDYRCSYCKRVAPAVMALVEEDAGIRLGMKEFPILSEDSMYAARAALAAEEQGLYWEMHVALMDHRGEYTQDVVVAIANSVGLDSERMLADMTSPEIDAIIAKNYELAQLLGISGTPAFVIGDTVVPGAIDIDTMRDLIAEARSAS